MIASYLLLLGVLNVVLVRLFRSFSGSENNPAAGMADAYYYYIDMRVACCFLLFVFFVFISYEFMRKTKEVSLDEVLSAKGLQGGLICLHQLLVLWIAVLIIVLNIFVFFLIGYFAFDIPEMFEREMIQIVIVDILLLSLASVGLGFLISGFTHRFIGYLTIIMVVFLTLPNTVHVFLDWQRVYHIPIFYLRDLICFIPPDLMALNDPLYGLPLEWYRQAAMLFWVVVSILICGWKLLKERKRLRVAVSACVLFILCVLTYGVENKGSVLLMKEHPKSALAETQLYYENLQGKEKNPEFTISDYDMELSMHKALSAVVKCRIASDKVLPSYEFTLFHGYNITKVEDGNGLELTFRQEGDYVAVENQSLAPVQSLIFYYNGYSPLFYANDKGCFLPGFFPYYPKAGYRKVCDGYFMAQKDSVANYRIKVTGDHSVVSNLEEHNGVLQGKTDNVILLKGYIKEAVLNQRRSVYYPLQRTSFENVQSFVSEEMQQKIQELKDFLGIHQDFGLGSRMVINIPWSLAFNSTLKPYYECQDYVLIQGFVEPYEILKANTKAPGKETMRDVFFDLMFTADTVPSELTLCKEEEWFDGYDEYTELYDAIILKVQKLGVRHTAQKIYQYLVDDTITADALTFIKNMK